MPETPPGPTSTPTASQEEQAEELDQAAMPAQTSAAPRREPPQAAADANSNGLPPGSRLGTMEELKEFMGQKPAVTSSNAASHADNRENKAQEAPSGHQPSTSTDQPKEQGHVPPSSPPARDGPAVPASVRDPPVAVAIPVGRVNGKFVSLKPNQPEPPLKSATAAVLKPVVPRTYDESGAESIAPKGGIEGLNAIPKSWGELPGSVSLSAAIEWVQQNRLYVVKETPGRGVKVDLSKAKTPAPSLTAISWLETSIRSYAKFIEVASKTATAGNDEAEFVRKERMRIGEIRALLEEMKDAGKVD